MHHMAVLEGDSLLGEAYERAALILADGWPVVLLLRLLGNRIRVRTTGSGLVEKLASSHVEKLGVTVVGGSSPDSNRAAVSKFAESGWKAKGETAPRQDFENLEDRRALVRRIIDEQSHLVIIGVGSPKQEILALAVIDAGFTGWVLCAGAGVDFLSGQTRRSPKLLRAAGLEWLHRIISDPRRLFVRYVKDLWPFFAVAVRSLKGTR
jgi:N-acetylglucosaminyldiphosphoundecaprenol N-acetyl-beta-D-mannosaminyltransferase